MVPVVLMQYDPTGSRKLWHCELPAAPVPGSVITLIVESEDDSEWLYKAVRSIEYHVYGGVLPEDHFCGGGFPDIDNVNEMPSCVVIAYVCDAVYSEELFRHTLPPLG